MNSIDTLLKNARLPDGRRTTIAIAGGRIAAIDAAEATPARERLDLGGDLVLPALVDGHMHLDKTLVGLPWMGHAAEPFRMSRIETDKRILPALTLSTEARAINLARICVAHGTGHIRTHVDVDLEGRLAKLEGVLAARERLAGAVTMQIVAFPQSGVMRCPGVLDLLDQAMRDGADLVGGIDPLEIDRDPKGQLDGIFAIAQHHGRGLDIHLHEPGEMGLFNVQEICARTKALGMRGKVTISHGFCLGGVLESKQKAAAEQMGEAGVMLVTHGAASAPLPPLTLLRQHGVTVFAGNDDVRDTWSPYGNGDMLERVSYIGWRADLRHDPMLHDIFALASEAGARALGLEGYGLAAGSAANLFTLPAEGIPEAVGAHPPRRLVFHRGRLVARNGAYCGP